MNSQAERRSIAEAAAEALAAAKVQFANLPVVIGFDGCVDSIIDVVNVRRGPGDYERMTSIEQFARRIADAAGKSVNVELVVKRKKLGGNAAIMAWAMQALGLPVTLAGALGDESGEAIEPVLHELAERCADVINTGPAAATDAAEFDDGKIMLGKNEVYESLTYERLKEVAGLDRLVATTEEARLIATVNWTMIPGMGGIWRGLAEDVLPNVTGNKQRRLFVDLADPAKRTREDLHRAMAQLSDLAKHLPLTLGLNLSEAAQVARVLDLSDGFASREKASCEELLESAQAIREALDIEYVLIHPRDGAAGAKASGEVAWFEGPFVASPRISTGGGDHFNAGAALASLLELPLSQILAVGTAVSGYYVRNAESPDLEQLIEFLHHLPTSDD